MNSIPPRPAVADTRTCTKCGEVKPLSEFPIKNARTGQRRTHCKGCRAIEKAAYQLANAEAIRASNAAYRAANRAALAERERAWREANPDRYSAIHSKHKAANKDAVNAATHRRRARIKGNGGSYTAAEWRAIKAVHDFRCLLCGRQEPEITLTVDHIVPISAGGRNTAENLQPLCKSCNSKKYRQALDLRAHAKGE